MFRLVSASLALFITGLFGTFATEVRADAGRAANAPAPDITIYHLEGRRSERIVWLMEELGMPYKLEYVRGDLAASMAKVRALGHEMPMVPTVVIDEQILVESGAIIDLILARYAPGRLTPARDSVDYPGHLMWMHYAEGSLAARLFSDYRAWRTRPPTVRSRFVDSEAVVQFSENHLAKHSWFGGSEFSTADIMMLFPLNVATGLNLVDKEKFPHIAAWKKKIENRPAYQRMLAAARPDGMIGNLPPIKQRPPSERK
ncbi:glutathione S-transferase family protein [Parasphingorhabdus marina]|nr:glutathione binding-like protein [Parasphingorhabdus marina]